MKKPNLNIILYLIYIIVYAVTISLYGLGNSNANIRYYVLMLLCIISFLIVVFTKKYLDKQFINKSFLVVIVVGILFLGFSIQKAYIANMSLPFRTFVQISLFFLPTVYAFYVSNFLTLEDIIKMFKITTIVFIVAYFFDFQEPWHGIKEFIKLDNWLSIDYLASNSFTESHDWSEAFLQLFLFFVYFSSKNEDRLDLKVFKIITLVFTFLCFKRLSLLVAVFFLVFGKYLSNKELRHNYAIPLAIFFTILTIFYTKFMNNEFLDYDKVFELTSGRNWKLYMWKMEDFLSYGYGSSMLVTGKYLEMDLVQIYLELNVLCLLIFCFCYFNICKNSTYLVTVMIIFMINNMTSSTMPWQISWVIMTINVAAVMKDCISTHKEGELNEKRIN